MNNGAHGLASFHGTGNTSKCSTESFISVPSMKRLPSFSFFVPNSESPSMSILDFRLHKRTLDAVTPSDLWKISSMKHPASSPREVGPSESAEEVQPEYIWRNRLGKLWKEVTLLLCRFQSRWGGRDEPLCTQETRGEAAEAEGQW